MGKAARKKKAPLAKAAKAPAKAKRKAQPAALPLPAAATTAKGKAKGKAKAMLPKPLRKAERRVLAPLAAAIAVPGGDASILDRLWQVVEERRQAGDTMTSHSARLLARGTAKVAQKLGEEAVECVIEAATGNRAATVLESADLLYHLMVVWVDAGIRPEEVWGELARRQGISGIAEKAARPRGILRAAGTSKLP